MAIQLHIATINTCNAKCHFCTYASPENVYPKGVMSMELYRKIIDEAKGIPEVGAIAFSALGEPLLDPHLVERVCYARETRADWYPIEVYTNGVSLTPARFEALKDAGVDSVTISLNAVRAKQHQEIMGLKGKFGTVTANARYATDHAGNVIVVVKAVRDDDHFREADQSQFLQTWDGRVVWQGNWAGGVEFIDARRNGFDPNSACDRALEQVSVLWDGVVTLCCFDPLAKHRFGDLSRQTIREVYNSDDYVQFRQLHHENRAAEHPMCRVCTRI